MGLGFPAHRSALAAAALLSITALSTSSCEQRSGNNPFVGDTSGDHLVVYASDRAQTGQFELYLYDLDHAGFRLLRGINSASDETNPTLTSDAQLIAFQSLRTAGAGSDIFLYDRAIGALVSLPGVNTSNDETEPAFTDDARRLAFVRSESGVRRIRLVDGVSDSLVPLPGLDTLATFHDWAPAPNLDGSMIGFVSNRFGSTDVFVWQRAGREVLDLPDLRSDSTDTEPALTPNGRYLCFASNRAGGAGGFDLYLYDLMGRTFVPLTNVNTASHERNPTLSVDGRVITFESNRDGGFGKFDLWNHDRTTSQTGQPGGLSSVGDDVQPWLRWR